ncbi:hypothetical protein PHLGIDRAFT_104554 [Phlebiopsis gigantea 11061_1 CR5-6]|uniref:Enoyl-CoA hydratase n=1 Tax=Phlebiopsis gigantea (strain 11061_1 CR5-6) TaxID=745531 RepID=A0A0C3NSV6_PHLG1|nr:hypothetical protein PHLGIDRAFT_104554 [Phlebiopsis gigantea 11061_1 CR5-6]
MTDFAPGQIPAALSRLATLKLSSPADHVLLVTLNRPQALNVFNTEMEEDMGRVMQWADDDRYIWVVVLTGAGSAFCAGGDLKPALAAIHTGGPSAPVPPSVFFGATDNGFGYLSRRPSGVKPIIAAVNGLTVGGGIEIVLNCDLVVASEKARFGLVEVKSGLVAVHGAIPRLARVAGHQLASEGYLRGRTLSAQEASARFGFINRVVPEDQVLPAAIDMANQAVASAITAGRAALRNDPSSEVMGQALEAIRIMKRRLIESRNLGAVESPAKL